MELSQFDILFLKFLLFFYIFLKISYLNHMEENNKFKEVEFKYNANDIKLVDFQKKMAELKPRFLIETSSWDFYYTNDKEESIRYRKSEIKPELTIKRKLDKDHNHKRIEINLGLTEGDHEETVDQFVRLLNYDFNFKIYKSCFIYFFDEVDVVYYIVYDENMVEQGRFLEIEFLEEKAHESEMDHMFKTLEKFESALGKFGINKKSRIPLSLFEMFNVKSKNKKKK